MDIEEMFSEYMNGGLTEIQKFAPILVGWLDAGGEYPDEMTPHDERKLRRHVREMGY